jgi:hypothetical protein
VLASVKHQGSAVSQKQLHIVIYCARPAGRHGADARTFAAKVLEAAVTKLVGF